MGIHEKTNETTSFDTATRRGFGDDVAVGKFGKWWHIVTRNGGHFQEITGTVSNYGGRTMRFLMNGSGCVYALFDYTDSSVMTQGWIEVDGDAEVFAGEEPQPVDLEE